MAYAPFILNAGTAGRWAVLAVGIPTTLYFLPENQRDALGVAPALAAGFLAWVVLSLTWTPNLYDGLDALAHLGILAMAFSLGGRLPSLLPTYVGLGLGFAVNGAVVLGQQFAGLDLVAQVFPPSGLFMSKNWLAEGAAMALVGLIGHRRWWLAAGTLPCLVFSNARGAMAGLAVAGLCWLWTRSRAWGLTAGAAGVVLAVIFASGWLADYRAFSLVSVGEREAIWLNTLGGLTWLGHGVGGFYHDYASHAPLQDMLVSRATHAHNDFLEAVYELGPGALLLFAVLGCCLRSPRPVERAVLTVLIVEASFGFPLHLPVTGFLAALVAGRLAADRVPLCGSLAARRSAIRCRMVGAGPASQHRAPAARPGAVPT